MFIFILFFNLLLSYSSLWSNSYNINFPQQSYKFSNIIKSNKVVGVLLPFTGKHRKMALNIFNGLALAIKKNVDNIDLCVMDTKGTVDGAKSAFLRMKQQGIKLVIGPLLATSTLELIDIKEEICILSFSNDQRLSGQGVYLLGMNYPEQMLKILSFSIMQGCKKVLVGIPKSPLGEVLLGRFQQVLEEPFGSILKIVRYEPKSLEYKSLLKELKSKKWDGFFLPEDGFITKKILSYLLYNDIEFEGVKFFGLDHWQDNLILRFKHDFEIFFTKLPRNQNQQFQRLFIKNFNEEPSFLSIIAFDIMTLILKHKDNLKNIPLILQDVEGFRGCGGLFRFLPDGSCQRALEVKKSLGKKVKRIKPPLPNFLDKSLT